MPEQKSTTPNPYDPARWRRAMANAVAPRYAFSATTKTQAKRWQSTLRRQFIKRLGGFPDDAAPLRPRTLECDDCETYTRETIRFSSRDGLEVFGYLLLPKTAPRPLPAVLCLCGHGYGVGPLVGIHPNQESRANNYQNDFAIQAVQHGYAALSIELLGFGHRRVGSENAPGTNTCGVLAGTALMMGQTLAGWRVYDAMRALDYLQTRPEIDAARLGAMGISGGGLNALYLAAVDARVRATMVSGFFNTFRDSIMAIHHCIDNFVPGLLQDAEMSDIAGLIAPRALWCENGTDDPIFPVKSFRRALREAKHIYQVFDAPEACGGEVFEGDHFFYGKGAWPFLEKHLKT